MKITYFHPALTALEQATTDLAEKQQKATASLRSINNSFAPSSWTRRIEEARDNAEELEYLRIRFKENALNAMSCLLSHEQSRRQLRELEQKVIDAIGAVIAVCTSFESKSHFPWLKQIMETRCIQAADVLERTYVEPAVQNSEDFKRVCNILVETFTAFAAELKPPTIRKPYSDAMVTPDYNYQTGWQKKVGQRDVAPTAYAVNPNSQLAASQKPVELRDVEMVAFAVRVNAQLPASQKLVELMGRVQPLLAAALVADRKLKGADPYGEARSKVNNRNIDEAQHASQQLEALLGTTGALGPSKDQLKAHNERRRLYQCVRNEVLIASRELDAIHGELTYALLQAVAETQILLAELQANKSSTLDCWETLYICMNNCLAVDLKIRHLGRELKRLDELYNHDLSNGTGRDAASAKFAEIRLSYRENRLKAVTNRT